MAGHDSRAARRYAAALFELARREEKLAAVQRDLRTVTDLMRLSPALRKAWDSPLIPGGRKRAIISDILGKEVDPLSLSFVRLLIDKRREEILDGVLFEMRRLSDVAERRLRAEATFAVQPSADEQTALARSLEHRTGDHVELTVHVDPAILGGVVVRMHDTIIDGSVRGTIERLREQLLQEA